MEAKSSHFDNDHFKWPILSSKQQQYYLQQAQQVLTAQAKMIHSAENNLLRYTLEQTQRHISMKHYPKGDRIDHLTGGHYFYHCHRENYSTTEHGHFHCFLRQIGFPKHLIPIPSMQTPKTHPMTHLVAISMNQLGQPIRLFTVNRWVSDDIWFGAKDQPQLLKQFKIHLPDDSPWFLIDQWIEGMVHLFAPQIHWLHQQREQITKDYAMHHFEDKAIEEISSIPINLSQQIEWIMHDTFRTY
ncbi:MAG TPA: hypothetical protein VHD33_01875 [Legionellaceae bacterium]|nr:hypothetical protein [Legionellaceae bacterium]